MRGRKREERGIRCSSQEGKGMKRSGNPNVWIIKGRASSSRIAKALDWRVGVEVRVCQPCPVIGRA